MSGRYRMHAALAAATMLASPWWLAGATAQDAPAQAAEAPADADDIIVTASRRDEQLSHVPASIAALSQAKMDSQGVRDVNDIARLTPGLNFRRESRFSGSNTNIAIRGIQSTDGAATTGIYIDDVPIQSRAVGFSSANTYPKIFDLQRVEVLRGPQGTLFGAGAEGGAVRFITPQPGYDRYSGYARAEVAFTENGDPTYEAGAAVGGPIVRDVLAFRASAWFRRDGGWVDRVDANTGTVTADANSENSLAFKAAIGWRPVEGLTITPSVYYQNVKIDDTSGYWEALTDRGDTRFRNGYVQAQPQRDRYVLPSLGVDWDFGGVTLISTTSWFDRNQRETRDYTNFDAELVSPGHPYPTLPGQVATGFFGDKQHNFTQEVRLQSNGSGPFHFVIGGFYSNERQSSYQRNRDEFMDTLIRNAFNNAFGIEGFFGTGYLPDFYIYDSITRSRTRQLAGFGQVDFKPTDTLTLTAGVRVAHVKVDHAQYAIGPFAGGMIDTSGSAKETPVTPKFGISWQVTPDNLVYASVAKGFRAGGAQTRVPALCEPDVRGLGYDQSPTSYDSDSVWSYEVGTKGGFLGGALTVDASAFYIKWKNIQTSLYLPTCGSSFIANAGQATSKGFDLALQGRPSDGLTLGLVMGYTHATYDEDVHGGSGLLIFGKGDYVYRGPKLSFTLSGQYDFQLGGTSADRDGFVRFDYSYGQRGPRNNPDAFGYDPVITNGDETNIINARAGIRRDGAELSLFVNNLTNSHPELARYRLFPGSPLITNATVRPRTIGLTATYRY